MDPRDKIEAIRNAENDGALELTEWEAEFVESIDDQLTDGKTLTEPQDESLHGIWRKIG
jgi:hypothetical protein